ncbi:MAG: hypothetical protein P9L99_16425 [Candidatus Lernaella stagnicola]|nr:hypothetical protein [Candidatus Lernaella stagnicola]
MDAKSTRGGEMIPEAILRALRCPISGESLRLSDDRQWLISDAAGVRYPIEDGVARLRTEAAEKTGDKT